MVYCLNVANLECVATNLKICYTSTHTQAHYSTFRLGKKMAAARNGNIYIEFYSSNNNVRRFLQLFSVLMLFIETINYKTGPCIIRRSIKMILKKVHFFSKCRFGDV